jgi:hypothetical protein
VDCKQELKNGISVETEDGQVLGSSSKAAKSAIEQVVPSRILMAAPGMIIPPIIMNKLEKTPTFIKNPWLKAPVTVQFHFIPACFPARTDRCLCAADVDPAGRRLRDLQQPAVLRAVSPEGAHRCTEPGARTAGGEPLRALFLTWLRVLLWMRCRLNVCS